MTAKIKLDSTLSLKSSFWFKFKCARGFFMITEFIANVLQV